MGSGGEASARRAITARDPGEASVAGTCSPSATVFKPFIKDGRSLNTNPARRA